LIGIAAIDVGVGEIVTAAAAATDGTASAAVAADSFLCQTNSRVFYKPVDPRWVVRPGISPEGTILFLVFIQSAWNSISAYQG
jgi:hypothetical protein